jgi:hypothetical protein
MGLVFDVPPIGLSSVAVFFTRTACVHNFSQAAGMPPKRDPHRRTGFNRKGAEVDFVPGEIKLRRNTLSKDLRFEIK